MYLKLSLIMGNSPLKLTIVNELFCRRIQGLRLVVSQETALSGRPINRCTHGSWSRPFLRLTPTCQAKAPCATLNVKNADIFADRHLPAELSTDFDQNMGNRIHNRSRRADHGILKVHDPKEIDVKGYLRKIKYYELDRDTKVDNNQIITLTGNGFNISIDKEKLTQQEYTQIKTAIDNIQAQES